MKTWEHIWEECCTESLMKSIDSPIYRAFTVSSRPSTKSTIKNRKPIICAATYCGIWNSTDTIKIDWKRWENYVMCSTCTFTTICLKYTSILRGIRWLLNAMRWAGLWLSTRSNFLWIYCLGCGFFFYWKVGRYLSNSEWLCYALSNSKYCERMTPNCLSIWEDCRVFWIAISRNSCGNCSVQSRWLIKWLGIFHDRCTIWSMIVRLVWCSSSKCEIQVVFMRVYRQYRPKWRRSIRLVVFAVRGWSRFRRFRTVMIFEWTVINWLVYIIKIKAV